MKNLRISIGTVPVLLCIFLSACYDSSTIKDADGSQTNPVVLSLDSPYTGSTGNGKGSDSFYRVAVNTGEDYTVTLLGKSCNSSMMVLSDSEYLATTLYSRSYLYKSSQYTSSDETATVVAKTGYLHIIVEDGTIDQAKYIVSVSKVVLPDGPTGVKAVSGSSSHTISWNAVSGATSYNLYYSKVSGSKKAGTEVLKVTSPYNFSYGSYDSVPFYFVVSAVSGGVESAASQEVSAGPIPNAPTKVSAVAASTSVTVSWAESTTTNVTYNIYYATGSVSKTSYLVKITGAASPYAINNLTSGKTYYFLVTAATPFAESDGYSTAYVNVN